MVLCGCGVGAVMWVCGFVEVWRCGVCGGVDVCGWLWVGVDVCVDVWMWNLFNTQVAISDLFVLS